MDDIIVGLDIGTTKVCAVIGELKEDRTINVLGAGSCSYSDGVKKGVIVDINRTTEAIVPKVLTLLQNQSQNLEYHHLKIEYQTELQFPLLKSQKVDEQ